MEPKPKATVRQPELPGSAEDPLTDATKALFDLRAAARDTDLPAAGALASLSAVRRLAADLERGELAFIEAARNRGATWAQIAAAMGATNRQTAQKRHADLTRRIYRPPIVDTPHAETMDQAGRGTAARYDSTASAACIEDTAAPSAETPAPARAARKRQAAPRITPKIIGEGRYELIKAPDHAESRAWNVLVGGKRAGLVRPTWRGERSRPGWQAVDNAGTALPVSGIGRVTAGGNARTRDAAAVSLLHALERQQEAERRLNN